MTIALTPKEALKLVPYEVCVYRTRTGEVVGWPPYSTLPDWEIGLNMSGSWRAYPTLDTDYMSKSDLTAWTEPWDWSWAICQGPKIWQAGPVLGEQYTDGTNQTTIFGVGLWQLLTDKRGMFNPNRASRSAVGAVDADISFGTGATSSQGAPIPAAHQNLNLRAIARRVVELILTEPGGDLPIDLPSTGPGTGVWTGTSAQDFPGYEMGTPGDRLLKLAELDLGPEIMFQPYFSTSQRKFVRHQMVIGDPRLGQLGYLHAWRSGAGLIKVDRSTDGAAKTRRQYERGSGLDRNVLVGFAEDLTNVTSGFNSLPLLEDIDATHMNVELATTLTSYATTDLKTNTLPRVTLQPEVTMDGTDGQGEESSSPVLSTVSPGDTGFLQLKDHPRLPDGNYGIRIVRMRGSGHNRATLDVQTL